MLYQIIVLKKKEVTIKDLIKDSRELNIRDKNGVTMRTEFIAGKHQKRELIRACDRKNSMCVIA